MSRGKNGGLQAQLTEHRLCLLCMGGLHGRAVYQQSCNRDAGACLCSAVLCRAVLSQHLGQQSNQVHCPVCASSDASAHATGWLTQPGLLRIAALTAAGFAVLLHNCCRVIAPGSNPPAPLAGMAWRIAVAPLLRTADGASLLCTVWVMACGV